jgi:thymidine phosphorylase
MKGEIKQPWVGLPQEWIRKKRDGGTLRVDEIQAFVSGVVTGEVTEAQIAALSMAIYFQDLNEEERVAMTLAVRDSGRVLDWNHRNLRGPVVDKHSTGGVGDTVSLMLAPMLAACGVHVPMIAGRGLAHTGGTIDKLEAIPGYQTGMDVQRFQRIVEEVGFAIVRQTDDLAPADRIMYATRDVTATVENLGLITTSIVSKKLAAGLSHLVLDVKCGNGAVMQDVDAARALAQSMVDVGVGAGMNSRAVMTDMSVPLAWSAGNSLEVREAVDYLSGSAERHPRLNEVVLVLGSSLLGMSGQCTNPTIARQQLEEVRDNGRALELLGQSIEAMGGNPLVLDRSDIMPHAPVVRAWKAPRSGVISGFDVRGVGMAVVALGGGRTRPDQTIDPRVGFSRIPMVGQTFSPGEDVVTIHAATESAWDEAARRWSKSLTWSDAGTLVEAPPVVVETVHPRHQV